MDFKKSYDSVKGEVLYNILIGLIKMCLNEMYSKIHIGKHLSDNFTIQNGVRQGDALPPLLFNVERSRKTRWD
jgi:hypothetical protein